MKRNFYFVFIGIIVVGLVSYFSLNNGESTTEGEASNIKELVHDYSTGNVGGNEVASITSHELIVTDSDQKETIYDLPADEFFVSIAPYVTETHPCAIHSLTGCQGELANAEFDIYIEDEEGNVILDEAVTSLENGFIDLWLPRDKTYHSIITFDGKTVESEFSTFEGDNTCITTMQLM
ncbi:CueP family metal-binding protein [Evansella cellulosilytica]|nr:CueP family metal-binding protein [Evansella cellulosilytica]